MDKKSSSRIYAYLAGACAAVLTTYYMITAVHPESNISFSEIEYIIEFALLCTALFLQNKVIVLAAACLSVVSDIYFLVAYFSVFTLLIALTDILLAIVVFSALKNKSRILSLWFLPALLRVIYSIVDMTVLYNYYSDYIFTFGEVMNYWGKELIGRLIIDVLKIGLYALAGYWLYISNPSYKPRHNTFTVAPSSAKIASNAGDTVECLEKYKQLLDCGAITEEEFRSKKNDLLNS